MLDSSKIWTPKPLNLRSDEGFSSNPNSPENQENARYAIPAPPPGLYNMDLEKKFLLVKTLFAW